MYSFRLSRINLQFYAPDPSVSHFLDSRLLWNTTCSSHSSRTLPPLYHVSRAFVFFTLAYFCNRFPLAVSFRRHRRSDERVSAENSMFEKKKTPSYFVRVPTKTETRLRNNRRVVGEGVKKKTRNSQLTSSADRHLPRPPTDGDYGTFTALIPLPPHHHHRPRSLTNTQYTVVVPGSVHSRDGARDSCSMKTVYDINNYFGKGLTETSTRKRVRNNDVTRLNDPRPALTGLIVRAGSVNIGAMRETFSRGPFSGC